MGFSIRKRTRGKTSWFNFSASENKGVHASYTQKLGSLTLNISKRGNRATFNFGHGLRWTSSSSSKKSTPSTKTINQTTAPQQIDKKPSVAAPLSNREVWILIFIMAIVMFIIQLYMKGS